MPDLFSKKHVVFDGAMGTLLLEAGLPAGASPDSWNITHPDAILSIHKAYLEAGAEVIVNYQSNAQKAEETVEDAADEAADDLLAFEVVEVFGTQAVDDDFVRQRANGEVEFKNLDPAGRVGSFNPARVLRIAFETAVTASS